MVEVWGNPKIDLGADKIVQALNYNIYPGKFAEYKWQDNSTDSSWYITKEKYQTNNTYHVTVTDSNGCTDRDTIALFLLVNDLEVTDMLLPDNACSMSNSELLNVKITNTGNAALSNKFVEVSYSLNGGPIIKENLNFNGAVGTSTVHTFSQPIDMSQKGNYSFKVALNMAADVQPVNDTATFLTKVLGYPKVDFGAVNDTLIVKLPYTLHAGPGYPEYLWQDNSTDSIFNISSTNYIPSNTVYSVIVSDVNSCTVSKSVNVIEARYDIAVSGINIPLTNCTLPSTNKLSVDIKNLSTVSIANQPVILSYTLNNGSPVSKQFNLTLSRGASKQLSSTKTLTCRLLQHIA
ncbi:MAG: hypothetical protein HC905_31175 [Bacteroidales bacterium]|nr:hypothetical protein [Bacteroidales bacterium]